MIKGTAPLTLTLNFNGTEQEFIDFVEAYLAEERLDPLDSSDAGDAMGWVIEECMLGTGDLTLSRGSFILQASIESSGDGFKWEGLDSPHTPI
jgi:hypothetical protein